jgi:hypothetical protein
VAMPLGDSVAAGPGVAAKHRKKRHKRKHRR